MPLHGAVVCLGFPRGGGTLLRGLCITDPVFRIHVRLTSESVVFVAVLI